MLDDLLGDLFGDALSRLPASRRAQLLARLCFGILGTVLGVIGAAHFLLRPQITGNTAMWLSMIALFVFLAAFCLFNVALGRSWRWPGRLFIASLLALFATRVLFGR